jgi:hypothetical protein
MVACPPGLRQLADLAKAPGHVIGGLRHQRFLLIPAGRQQQALAELLTDEDNY